VYWINLAEEMVWWRDILSVCYKQANSVRSFIDVTCCPFEIVRAFEEQLLTGRCNVSVRFVTESINCRCSVMFVVDIHSCRVVYETALYTVYCNWLSVLLPLVSTKINALILRMHNWVKNEWSYTFIPPYVLWHAQEQLYFCKIRKKWSGMYFGAA